MVQPRASFDNAIYPLNHATVIIKSSTLPKVRNINNKIAVELPAIKYGSMTTNLTVTRPLKVTRNDNNQHKYAHCYTTGIIQNDVPVIKKINQIQDIQVQKQKHKDKAAERESPNAVVWPSSSAPADRARTTRSRRTTRKLHKTVVSTNGTVIGNPPPAALLRAAKDNDLTAVKDVLLHSGRHIQTANGNAVDATGRTAISYAVSNGAIDILEVLLQIPGIDPNLADNEGNTPLHFAAQAGQVECLNFLLSRCQNLEIDARNNLGFTPLMKAALQGRNKCAKLLLFAGANPTLRDVGRGLRADQWARFCGRYGTADVIEKFARNRLLERSTSSGRWGSENDVKHSTRIVLGKVVPVPNPLLMQNQSNQTNQGIKSKLRKVFRTSSGPSNVSTTSSTRLVTQLTTAALCASSPVLPTASSIPPVVKSLIRPLTVPRLQITLANNFPNEGGNFNALLEQNSRIKRA